MSYFKHLYKHEEPDIFIIIYIFKYDNICGHHIKLIQYIFFTLVGHPVYKSVHSALLYL